MATLTINSSVILSNINKLNDFLSGRDIKWSLVTKILGGNRKVLEKLLNDPSIKKLHSVSDSRLSNLKVIKDINPGIITMYIKPPAPVHAANVVKYSDISLNSSLKTIQSLSREAIKSGKTHRIIIMIELGELREGVVRDKILSFYENVFKLQNISVDGLGTNLGCMYGVEPTYDKLVQLSLYKQLIEEKFDKKLEIVSAGSSITLPLVMRSKIPKGVNHFRIGETVFFGVSIIDNKKFRNLSTNAFSFSAEVLEVEKKAMVPDGNITDAGIGQTAINPESSINSSSYKAIVDFGEIDVDVKNIQPKDKNVRFFGTTSDMTVYSLGDSTGEIKVGGQIQFKPNYMAVARLMNSKYVTKLVK